MYTLERLNSKNLLKFKKIYNTSKSHPIDFFLIYDDEPMFKKFLIRRTVFLLEFDKKCTGYIWLTEKNNIHTVIEMFINEEHFNKNALTTLAKRFLSSSKVIFKSEENSLLLKTLLFYGFKVENQVREMEYAFRSELHNPSLEGLNVLNFKKGKDEFIRCELQNEIFNQKNRMPLKVKDIYYDEMQKYYYDNGMFLLTLNNDYIGIGQIIFEITMPVLVNFGIIKEHRHKGYGEYFLKYILNFLHFIGREKVILRVDNDNIPAKKLYKKIGFVEREVIYTIIKQDS